MFKLNLNLTKSIHFSCIANRGEYLIVPYMGFVLIKNMGRTCKYQYTTRKQALMSAQYHAVSGGFISKELVGG